VQRRLACADRDRGAAIHLHLWLQPLRPQPQTPRPRRVPVRSHKMAVVRMLWLDAGPVDLIHAVRPLDSHLERARALHRNPARFPRDAQRFDRIDLDRSRGLAVAADRVDVQVRAGGQFRFQRDDKPRRCCVAVIGVDRPVRNVPSLDASHRDVRRDPQLQFMNGPC
jgi:hypothetical protein